MEHRKLNNSLIDLFIYEYYPDGRLKKETDSGNRVREFQYDRLGQLVHEAHPSFGNNGISYTYDVHGNRTSLSQNSFTENYDYDAADKLNWIHRNQKTKPVANQTTPYALYTYDDLGQLIHRDRRLTATDSRRQHTFKWDSAGRLQEALRGANPAFSATYTADGERVSKTDSVTGSHIYSYGLFDSNESRIYAPGLAQSANGATRKHHHDWLGSVRYYHNPANDKLPTLQRYEAFGWRSVQGGDNPVEYPSDFVCAIWRLC